MLSEKGALIRNAVLKIMSSGGDHNADFSKNVEKYVRLWSRFTRHARQNEQGISYKDTSSEDSDIHWNSILFVGLPFQSIMELRRKFDNVQVSSP